MNVIRAKNWDPRHPKTEPLKHGDLRRHMENLNPQIRERNRKRHDREIQRRLK